MSDIAAEQLYEYTAQVAGTVEYGASLQAILAGETPPPPGGLQVDVAFGGPVTGRLNGSVVGVDYLNLRADGRIDLDIRGDITTSDGEKRISRKIARPRTSGRFKSSANPSDTGIWISTDPAAKTLVLRTARQNSGSDARK